MYEHNSRFNSRTMRAWLLGAILALVAGTASAEPQQARFELDVSRQQYQIMDINFQVGRALANTGNAGGARSSFIQAQVSAALFGIRVVRLQQQNQDSLQRGLYANRAALEQAIACNAVLRVQAQILQVNLSVLAQQPLSQAQINQTYVQLLITSIRMQQCVQYQLQAGG